MIAGLFMASCTTGSVLKQHADAPMNKLALGFSEDELLSKRPNAQLQDDGMEFRRVYLEMVDDEDIQGFVYYVDAELSLFYELIVIYKDEATREAAVNRLLGEVGFDGEEWTFEQKGAPTVRCWTFKEKIVYAACIPGTEWEDECK